MMPRYTLGQRAIELEDVSLEMEAELEDVSLEMGAETPKQEVVRLINSVNFQTRRSVIIACDDARTILGIRSQYHATYIEELKKTIPSSHRAWDPDHRMWFVSPTYYNIILDLCNRFFGRYNEHNTAGLELLNPEPVKTKTPTSKITKKLIELLKVEYNKLNNEEIICMILTAWDNKQITEAEAMVMIGKLYS